jgi:hypothetical protein
MAQWGNTDDAANSVLWGPDLLKAKANTGNQTDLYANTTVGAFIGGLKTTIVGVSTAEVAVGAGVISAAVIVSGGSGYAANATVTVDGGGGADGAANAQANATTGKIELINITDAGTGYESSPSLAISAPAAFTFNSNTALYVEATFNALTAVANTTEFITIASNPFVNNDILTYTVAAGNTAVGGLTNAASYFVVEANSTVIQLALTQGGAAINVTASVTETGHTLRRVGFIEIASNKFQTGDKATYLVAAGNTALTGLANNTQYTVSYANTTGLYLAASNGSVILPTPGVGETGHSLTGETATAIAVVGGARNKGALPGWALRTEGTGGRAGRVHYETLVAMGSISGGDDSDDTILPDS